MADTNTASTIPGMVVKQLFRFDKTENGWELVENNVLWGEPELIIDTFLQDSECYLVDDTMLELSKTVTEEKGPLAGQLYAELMLAQLDQIPVEWRRYRLVFVGTMWRDQDGQLWITCLEWNGVKWRISWVDRIYDANRRAVRISK